MELWGETMEDKTGPKVHLVDRFCAEYGPTGISFKSYHKLAINSRLIHHTCMISWKQLTFSTLNLYPHKKNFTIEKVRHFPST